MRQKIIMIILVIISLVLMPQVSSAKIKKPALDSRELQLQDMLTLFLLPYMNDKLSEVYAYELNAAPELYPYFVDVTKTDRLNGFRGYTLSITLHAHPTVGPHIPVGEDLFTFEVSPLVNVKLVTYEHLKGPKKSDFPPNYQDLLKKNTVLH
ncbi:DUF3888 domain-containing protein [Cohnella abietis]|uniref:DUF3888 domain-containing protein n=1 Tax=Cohnella abietis TaxID=2507935 RepID=A0A3T1D6T6_9BACL|nr:DUF3888 domain-containing protein [Cohnella abietis]BBI33784.1 hypothetical protein KCTCHS21_31830 [Cohnella abietis]